MKLYSKEKRDLDIESDGSSGAEGAEEDDGKEGGDGGGQED